MTVKKIGEIDGKSIEEISLASPDGARASVLTLGATLRDLVVPLNGTELRRVVLGYRDPLAYRQNPCYLGATVGRCANRIAGGRFCLNGKNRQLTLNEGSNHLHGGTEGISRRWWTIERHDENSTTLSLISRDGDQGYPGTARLSCMFRLDAPSTLHIEMSAVADAPTILNLAHHSYFRLGEGDSRTHALWIDSRFITPTDEALLPTGEIRAVANTRYDFTSMRTIQSQGDDFDVNYVLNRANGEPALAASVLSPQGDLRLDLLTTEPGLQLYNGFALSGLAVDLDGKTIGPYAGLCLEPQKFPDAPNHAHFPSARLDPGGEYRQIGVYRFVPLS